MGMGDMDLFVYRPGMLAAIPFRALEYIEPLVLVFLFFSDNYSSDLDCFILFRPASSSVAHWPVWALLCSSHCPRLFPE